MKTELDNMLKLGIARPSSSHWGSPVVLAERKYGGVRFCVDYCKHNQVSKCDAYPMPRVEDVLERVGPATCISTIDLACGYWQVPMMEKSQETTAFTTPFRLYDFVPFGLHNAPATFQRLMDIVLQEGRKIAQGYMDDIIVFSDD